MSSKVERGLLRTGAAVAIAWTAMISSDGVAFAADEAPAADPGQPAAASDSSTNSIVVTARRRQERLQDVPVAVSAVSGTMLREYQITSVQDAAKFVPTLLVSQSISGTGAAIFLRGIGTSTLSRGFDQSVSISIDNVPISRGNAINFGYLDMDQFTVLRGPQALFYGKNATGGIISITSRDPGRIPEFSALGGYEFDAKQVYGEAVASGPLTDNLGIRVALRGSTQDGYFHNTAVAYVDPRGYLFNPAGDRFPNNRSLSGRVTFKYEPSSSFSARLKIFAADVKSQPATRQLGYCSLGTPRPSFGVIDSVDDCIQNDTLTIYKANSQFQKTMPYVGDGNPYANYRSFLPVLDMTWSPGKISLNSISSYYYNQQNILASYQGGQSIGVDRSVYRAESEELRLNTKFEFPLNLTAGGYYQHSSNPVYNARTVGVQLAQDPANGKIYSYDENIRQRADYYSIFGEVAWKIAPKFEIDGGARVSWENRYAELGLSYAHPSYIATHPINRPISGTTSSSNVSPQVTLTYKPDSDLTFFTGYRTAYKSGGFNTQTVPTTTTVISSLVYKPEKAKGFDAGIKSSLFDRRLTINATIYTFDYKDLQVQVYDPATISFSVGNAGLLRTRGVELESALDLRRDDQGLQLRGSLSYNDAKYHDYIGGCYAGQSVAAGCNQFFGAGKYNAQDYNGRRPPRAPEWTMGAGATYTVPLSSQWSAALSTDLHYTSKFYLTDALNPNGVQPGYTLIDATLRVYSKSGSGQSGEFGRDKLVKW